MSFNLKYEHFSIFFYNIKRDSVSFKDPEKNIFLDSLKLNFLPDL